MAEPSDRQLTEEGYREEAGARLLVIACGALAREIIALRDQLALPYLDLHCLPAILHNTPEQIPDAVEAAVLAARERYDDILIGYADCGTGGLLKQRCDTLNVEMIDGPHCYSFFDGNARFAARGDDEMRAFYLTDFLARQFDAFVTRPLGLDRHPELRDMYFGQYETLIYLAQTDDPLLTARAREAAEKLGLAFEQRLTGYGDLANALRSFHDRFD